MRLLPLLLLPSCVFVVEPDRPAQLDPALVSGIPVPSGPDWGQLIAEARTLDPQGDEKDLWRTLRFAAEDVMRASLRSPSTAEFPWRNSEWRVAQVDADSYVVSSYVDAQNGFGATIRSYMDVVFQVGSETVELEVFRVDGRRQPNLRR